MSRKTSPARRAAFLKALSETGNQTISAERAKVSRSWMCLHRSTDPEFDADCRAAIAAAKARLAEAGRRAPPSAWGYIDGVELVVRGTGGARRGRRIQIARARLKQWTARIEERFLSVLAATCNVKRACAAVGLTPASAFAHAKSWPRFARRWDEAIEIGRTQIDSAVAEAVNALFGTPPIAFEQTVAPITIDDAIRLARLYERRAWDKASGRPPFGRRRPPANRTAMRERGLRERGQSE